MKIYITSGTGSGLTKLAAFDNALYDAGIANYNLIKLSSVIPDNSKVIIKKLNWNNIEHGYKLYTVIAESFQSIKGKKAYAGLGWITQDKTGKGIFVEHSESSEIEVKNLIYKSFKSIKKYRKEEHGKINMKIQGTKCINEIVCSIVCAVYKSEGWK